MQWFYVGVPDSCLAYLLEAASVIFPSERYPIKAVRFNYSGQYCLSVYFKCPLILFLNY